MNDSDVVRIPVAVAVIVLSVLAVLLVSLAITVVFFDRDGYRRRLTRRVPALGASTNGGARGKPIAYARPATRKEPWGKRR